MFVIYYLIGINILTFLAYGLDKWKARRDKWRIPEATLILLAVFGGSVGALLGMSVFDPPGPGGPCLFHLHEVTITGYEDVSQNTDPFHRCRGMALPEKGLRPF